MKKIMLLTCLFSLFALQAFAGEARDINQDVLLENSHISSTGSMNYPNSGVGIADVDASGGSVSGVNQKVVIRNSTINSVSSSVRIGSVNTR